MNSRQGLNIGILKKCIWYYDYMRLHHQTKLTDLSVISSHGTCRSLATHVANRLYIRARFRVLSSQP